MIEQYYILIGILLGGFISLITALIVQTIQNRRELYKLAFELAKEEYKTVNEKYAGKEYSIAPLEAFVAYHLKFLKVIKKWNFKIEDLDQVKAYKKSLEEYYTISKKNK